MSSTSTKNEEALSKHAHVLALTHKSVKHYFFLGPFSLIIYGCQTYCVDLINICFLTL